MLSRGLGQSERVEMLECGMEKKFAVLCCRLLPAIQVLDCFVKLPVQIFPPDCFPIRLALDEGRLVEIKLDALPIALAAVALDRTVNQPSNLSRRYLIAKLA